MGILSGGRVVAGRFVTRVARAARVRREGLEVRRVAAVFRPRAVVRPRLAVRPLARDRDDAVRLERDRLDLDVLPALDFARRLFAMCDPLESFLCGLLNVYVLEQNASFDKALVALIAKA